MNVTPPPFSPEIVIAGKLILAAILLALAIRWAVWYEASNKSDRWRK